MSLLPILTSIVNRKSLIVILLFTIHLSLFTLTLTRPVFAAHTDNPTHTEPSPAPCTNPLFTDQLTKIVIEPKVITASVSRGREDHTSVEFEVDFSQLAAIFAPTNSDYLEGKFQEEAHRTANVLALENSQFNQFHAAGQKAAPKIIVDELKKEYVKYIYDHPHLPEASARYTDIKGEGQEKRIYDLIQEFGGLPNPPESGGDRSQWLSTWGQYWEKIPTAVSEFYYGVLTFSVVKKDIAACPDNLRRIYFVLPEYFRTTSVGNQLNQVIVPKAAQSSTAKFVDNNLKSAVTNTKTALAKIVEACLKPFIDLDQTLAKTFRKVVKITLDWVNPIKPVYAAVKRPGDQLGGGIPEACPALIGTLPKDKKGTGPFCSFPEFDPGTGVRQLRDGDRCDNIPSQFKLDSGRGLWVKCTFVVNINLDSFETDCPEGSDCVITIKVFPVFYIPWLAPIWNNTTYSDQQDNIAIFGTGKTGKGQETGRPGIYTFFKPKSVDSAVFPDGKNLPSKEQGGAQAIKQRFFGAVDCAKEFTRDIALKPKALQENQRISVQTICKTNL